MENVFITRSVYVRVADLFSKHSLIRISCLPMWVFAFQSNRAKYWFPFEQRKSKLDTCLSILCAVLIYEVYLLHSPLHFYLVFFWGNRIPNKIRVTEPCGRAYFIFCCWLRLRSAVFYLRESAWLYNYYIQYHHTY